MNPLTQAAGIDPELEALMQRRAQLEQEINFEAQSIEKISTPKPKQEYRQMAGNIPTLGQMYGLNDEPFSPPAYKDTEEDTPYLTSGGTSYEELEAEMSANIFKQIPQNYGSIIEGGIPNAETLIPAGLAGYGSLALANPYAKSSLLVGQVDDRMKGAEMRKKLLTGNNLSEEFDKFLTEKGGLKKNQSKPLEKFLDENGITKEMVSEAPGSNRGEKVKNAVQNKYRSRLGMRTMNALTFGQYGKDELNPKAVEEQGPPTKKQSKKEAKKKAEEEVKSTAKKKRIQLAKGMGGAAALAPAFYGVGESISNMISGESLEDEAAKQAEVYNSNMVTELKQRIAGIDAFISTSKNEAGKIKAGEDRARLLELLKTFE